MDGHYWVCQDCGACNNYEADTEDCYNCGNREEDE